MPETTRVEAVIATYWCPCFGNALFNNHVNGYPWIWSCFYNLLHYFEWKILKYWLFRVKLSKIGFIVQWQYKMLSDIANNKLGLVHSSRGSPNNSKLSSSQGPWTHYKRLYISSLMSSFHLQHPSTHTLSLLSVTRSINRLVLVSNRLKAWAQDIICV